MSTCVLCAVDRSPEAELAAAAAAGLARDLGRELLLVHVMSRPRSFPYGDRQRTERGRRSARRRGEHLLASLARDHGSFASVRSRIEEGDPAQVLVTVAKDERAELVVLGPRGRGPLRSALFGSTSDRIASSVRCPVVMANPGCEAVVAEAGARYRSIVCGVEDADLDLPVARVAGDLAERLDAPLHVIQSPSPSRGPKHLVRVMSRARLRGRARVAAGPPAHALERTSEKEDSRLIVVGAGRGGLRGLVYRSVSQDLAALGATPIAILPRDGSPKSCP